MFPARKKYTLHVWFIRHFTCMERMPHKVSKLGVMPKSRELTRTGRRLATIQKRDDASYLAKTFNPASNGAQIMENGAMKLEKTDRINMSRLNAIEKTLVRLHDANTTENAKNNAIESLAYTLGDKNGKYLGIDAQTGEKDYELVSSPAFIEPLQQKIQFSSANLENDLAIALQGALEKRAEIAAVRQYLETADKRASQIGRLKAKIAKTRLEISDAQNDTEREKLHKMVENLEIELANI